MSNNHHLDGIEPIGNYWFSHRRKEDIVALTPCCLMREQLVMFPHDESLIVCDECGAVYAYSCDAGYVLILDGTPSNKKHKTVREVWPSKADELIRLAELARRAFKMHKKEIEEQWQD